MVFGRLPDSLSHSGPMLPGATPVSLQDYDDTANTLPDAWWPDPFALSLSPLSATFLAPDFLAATPVPAPLGQPAAMTQASPMTQAAPPANPVGNQADQAMLASIARATDGVTGAGVKIGILSDSFDVKGGYAADIASGALPGNVTVLKEGPSSGTDEGQAMAELIHKVAPGAQIYFYTAFDGEADFANGINALASAGCSAIVDDVTYMDEPFFQSGGVVSTAVAAVVAKGVSYFTSASNEGENFYQSGFQGIATVLPGLTGNYVADNFGTTAAPNAFQSLTIGTGSTATIDLQWDQPFASIGTGQSSANSLGMVLYNAAGQIVAYALRNVTGTDPDQILRFTNTTAATGFTLAIITNGGNTVPDLFKYIVYGQGTTINDPNAGIGSGTVIGHEMVAGANSVGAVAAANTPAFGGTDQVEGFSSGGPGQVVFDGYGNRVYQTTTVGKVDFVAPDGVPTSVYNPFYGTSAAAPDAAAVAALMLQADPTLTPAQVTAMLEASAIPASGPAGTTGAGLIQAPAAVQAAQAAEAASQAAAAALQQRAASNGSGKAATTAWSTTPANHAVSQAAATVAADPSSAQDFYVGLSGLDASVAAGATAANAGASAQAYATLNNPDGLVVPIDPHAIG